MSMFGSILQKIVHYAEAATGIGAPSPAPAAAATPAPTPATAEPAAAAAPAGGETSSLADVDVGSVLAARAAAKGGGLNWQTSIVDLLKTLDLDSSLSARKQLADELDVHVGADGSAEENVALHRAVVAKLQSNGGTFPAGAAA